ncbi:RNA polymerase C-22 sterol desaturase [Spiromyces aspiralis]|uniref:RNA polymerase C-22 sterol desaturase n=1 Tax=Spiromyces aspiralis TaxID=68401 RepID=A0ACC1HHB4_9FUNG|nr:RNA polymerase C-22 sterol desaturase [Spiromyces aspiralis]
MWRDVEEFDKLIYGLMNRRLKEALERKVQGKVLDDDERARADLLTLMAEAAVNPTEMHRTETGINTITEKDLRANVVLFYVAGHDTTASSLSYTLLELARQPDFQSKARDEIFRVLDKDGHGETIIPTEEQQKTFTYLNAIIYETQRKYPVVTVLARKPQGPVQLGKYHIAHNPKNSVGIYVYGLHHDPDIYPDPDEFIPERFDTKSDSDSGHHRRRVPFSWIPFSEGQRMCLGKRFSLVEQRVILAVLLQRFRLQLPANSPYWNDSFTKNSFVATPTGLRIEFVPLGH